MKNEKMHTVGETARRLGTTVRTLQYYDKEGLLSPSGYSESGRRLYSDRDIVGLYQILSLKEFGLSLAEIKQASIKLNTPEDVIKLLEMQKQALKQQADNLLESINSLGVLGNEIARMNEVDFEKYAQILTLLKEHNKEYWTVKFFKKETINSVMNRFTKEEADEFIEVWKSLCKQIIELKKRNVLPESEEGQEIAAKWWNHVMKFTNGDMEILQELVDFNSKRNSWDESFRQLQDSVNEYINLALKEYFRKQGINIQ